MRINHHTEKLIVQLKSFISLIEYHQQGIFSPAQDKALEEFKEVLKKDSGIHHFNFWSYFAEVLKVFPQDKYKKQIELIYELLSLIPAKPYIRRANHPPERPLELQSTKELLNKLSHCDWDEDPEQLKIREILKTREHVLNKSESKLIRKMSIHAGQKLSLKEAKALSKKVKR